MATVNELKNIPVLNDLPQHMLEKLGSVSLLQIYSEGTVLFREKESTEYLYLLMSGKVLLEVEVSRNVSVTIEAVKPGDIFGISTLAVNKSPAMQAAKSDYSQEADELGVLKKKEFTATATCVEPCEIITIKGDALFSLFKKDHELGYLIMHKMIHVFKNRLDRRTSQFIKALENHPEIQKVFQQD